MRRVFFFALVTIATTDLKAQHRVTFNVKELTVLQHDNIYITGNFNNWNTANTKNKIKSSKSGNKFITIELPAGKCEYKFTRGNWLTIEKDIDCDEIENRVGIINKDTTIDVIIQNWKDLCITEDLSIAELQLKIYKEKSDSVKVKFLLKMSFKSLTVSDYQSASNYAEQALLLSKKSGFKVGLAETYRQHGHILIKQNNYAQARKNLVLSLKLWEELNQTRVAEYVSEEIGTTHKTEGNYAEALRFYYLNLRAHEKKAEKASVARTLVNIGEMHSRLGNNSEAIKIYEQALHLLHESWDLYREEWIRPYIGQCYHSIAAENANVGNYAEALVNNSLGLKIFKETGDKAGISLELTAMGNICGKQGLIARLSGDESLAAKKFTEALKLLEESITIQGMSSAYINAGRIFTYQKNYSKAKRYLGKGLRLSRALASKEGIKQSFHALAELDSAQRNFIAAYDHYKMYILYRDSLVNEESARKSEIYRHSYEFEKKEDQIRLLSTENKLNILFTKKESQRKNFAYAGIGAILLAGGYGFSLFRNRKRRQNKQALMQERLRISRELHDEVGATLSGIAMYSHLTKELIKNSNIIEVEKSLTIMQQSAREMVNKLNDIVWLTNPEQDSLQQLLQRLEEYAIDMARTKNMKMKISIPDQLQALSLGVERRRNIYLFCKEAINNAVKYSDGSLLELNIKEVNGHLKVSVTDDGKGFEKLKVKRGNGLQNMQVRADEIGAMLTIQSKIGEGALVAMQLKIT